MAEPTTWRDLVRKYIPDASNEFCDYILWNESGFPEFGTVAEIEEQIKDYAKATGHWSDYQEVKS